MLLHRQRVSSAGLFLKKHPVTSGGSRSIIRFKTKWSDYSKHPKLTYLPKNNAGRGNTGQIVLWSKNSVKHKFRNLKINYTYRSKYVGFIATFVIIPLQTKLLALVFFNSGYASYIPTTELHKIFMFLYSPFYATSVSLRDTERFGKNVKNIFKNPMFFILHQIKRNSIISLIELLPHTGVQYCRSSGCKSRLINTDPRKGTALVQLPSGVKKIVSLFSTAYLGQVSIPFKKYCTNTKAGYWRSLGKKSMVRGVARNPVDHPHGGRTKSIKYPRTPWGKTTKFK